jgi:hypothetical protein
MGDNSGDNVDNNPMDHNAWCTISRIPQETEAKSTTGAKSLES